MKRVILFFALLAAGLGLRAQDGGQISAQDSIQDSTRHYASYFGENATEWTTGWFYPTRPHVHYHTYIHWVSGDTTIGNYTYKRVLGTSHLYEFYLDGQFDSAHTLPFYMREDTLTGRLWILHAIIPDSPEEDTAFVERLVCDMSLEMGDSILLTGTFEYQYYEGDTEYTTEHLYIVTRVDEYNGRRRLKLEYNNLYSTYFYEGAGSGNLFYPTLAGIDFGENRVGGNSLGCVLKDDTVFFSNPELAETYVFFDCEFHMTGSVDESETPFAVTLYPNPCKELLQIANLPDGVQGLYVTDMLGRCVYSTAQPAEGIPTAQLPQGVYRLTMVMNDNQHYSLTFVKR